MSSNQNNSSLVSGELIKILPKKSNFGSLYYDCLFKMVLTGSCFRSCIYTKCRNFENWKNYLEVGNILGNLKLISKYKKLFVDADSFSVLIRKANPEIKEIKPVYGRKKLFKWRYFK